MARGRWETVSPGEVRAEVEAVLESQGQSEQIFSFLRMNPQIAEWRAAVRQLCRDVIDEAGPAGLTPDLIFEQVAARAHDLVPPEVRAEVRAQLEAFLQTQFEDRSIK
jgi:hypothetical protein